MERAGRPLPGSSSTAASVQHWTDCLLPSSARTRQQCPDASGNGNNGTVYGATPTADRDGNPYSAYSFDGTNDYIQVPSSNLSFPGSLTFSAWVRNLDIPFGDGTRNHIITLSPHNALDLEPTYQYSFRIRSGDPYSVYTSDKHKHFCGQKLSSRDGCI